MNEQTQNLAKVIKDNVEGRRIFDDSDYSRAQVIAYIYIMKDYARTLPGEQVQSFFTACGFPLAKLQN